MKQNLFNKLWLRVGMIVAIMTTALAGTAWAADETITFSDLGLTNQQQYTTINGTDCVLTFGDGGNDGKYYNTGAAIRVYGGGHMTVSSTTKTITNIELTFGTGDGSNAISTNVGSYSNGTWTGSASSVTFTVAGTSGHRRIASVAVTYAGSTPVVTIPAPTLSPAGGTVEAGTKVTISNANSNYLYYYTTDGVDPEVDDEGMAGNESTFAFPTNGYTINSTTTLKVIATDGEGNVSPVTSATYTVEQIIVGGETLTFDFEESSAHRPSGETNSFATNTYSENGVNISLTYADATTTGSPLSGSAHVVGRVAKATTNSPVVLIGPIDITNWTIAKIEYKTKGVAAMSQVFATSLDNSNWTTQLSLNAMPTQATTETISDLSITGTQLYLKWTVSVSSTTNSNRDFNLDDIVITYTESSNPVPTITASDVEIAYNATSGSFNFTINNPVDGGTTTVSENVDWISNAVVSGNSVTFTTTANEATTSREGVITLTYTYGEETTTKDVTVTQAGNPNASGTENNPYTVAQARAAIDANTGITGVYATGVVTAIPTAWSTQYDNITFNFVDADGDGNVLQAYRCVSTNNADASTVAVGDIVVVYGNLTKYGSTYEFGQGCQLVSLTHPVVAVEAPTFSLASGTFAEAQTVTITCATQGATIYYTIDGSEPTAESTEYTGAITVSTTMTIKAIAIKGEDQSAIASATYTIFVLEDGVFNFAAKMSDYGSGIEPTSNNSYYDEEASTWTAGNVTLVASGKYRWWNNGGELRFYNNDPQSKMTISVPNGKVITSIVVTGGTAFEADCGTYESGSWTGFSQTVVLTVDATSSQNVKTVTVAYIDAVKPSSITLNSEGYATFASTSPVDLGETDGCTAWAVTAVEGTSITFTQVEGVVAAGTGLLLKGAAGATITPEYSTNAGSPVTGNLLEAIVTPTTIAANQYYGLSGKTFVKVNAGQVPAGKALLPASALTSGVKTFTFSFDDDATAIGTVETFTEEGAIYNLAGQRISKMQKGINIVNGKKVLK